MDHAATALKAHYHFVIGACLREYGGHLFPEIGHCRGTDVAVKVDHKYPRLLHRHLSVRIFSCLFAGFLQFLGLLLLVFLQAFILGLVQGLVHYREFDRITHIVKHFI